jgi:hypothetical protein
MDLVARDGRDLRGAAEQLDSWCTEHIRPWYEDHVYADVSLLARFRGEALDIDAANQLEASLCERAKRTHSGRGGFELVSVYEDQVVAAHLDTRA